MDAAAPMSPFRQSGNIVCAQMRGLGLGPCQAMPCRDGLMAWTFTGDAASLAVFHGHSISKRPASGRRGAYPFPNQMGVLPMLGRSGWPPQPATIRYCNPKLQPPPSLFFPIKIQTLAVFIPSVAAFLAAFAELRRARAAKLAIGLFLAGLG